MDKSYAQTEFYLQLLELVRAGWHFAIEPVELAPTLGAVSANIIWTRTPTAEQIASGNVPPAICVPINAFSPTSLQHAIAQMHAQVFPTSPFGDLPATLA